MKKILIILITALLIISCSDNTNAYYLESENYSVAYLANNRHAVKIDIDISTLSFLSQKSGKRGKELIEDFFGVSILSYAHITDESFLERESLFNALKDVTSSSDTLHAFSSFRGDLRKTDFTATINNISSDFDDIELSKNIKKKTAVNEYHLKNVVSTTHSYDENKKFVKKWVENILGNI